MAYPTPTYYSVQYSTLTPPVNTGATILQYPVTRCSSLLRLIGDTAALKKLPEEAAAYMGRAGKEQAIIIRTNLAAQAHCD